MRQSAATARRIDAIARHDEAQASCVDSASALDAADEGDFFEAAASSGAGGDAAAGASAVELPVAFAGDAFAGGRPSARRASSICACAASTVSGSGAVDDVGAFAGRAAHPTPATHSAIGPAAKRVAFTRHP